MDVGWGMTDKELNLDTKLSLTIYSTTDSRKLETQNKNQETPTTLLIIIAQQRTIRTSS
jgi:hypothetical protein